VGGGQTRWDRLFTRRAMCRSSHAGPRMDRLKIVGVVVVAACVSSCARTWSRPGADAADLDREKFECQFEASKTVASAGTQGPEAEARRDELEGLCMEAKGWSRSWGR
jgi:hypothetical protein